MLGSRQAQPGGHEATQGAQPSANHPTDLGITILRTERPFKTDPSTPLAVCLIVKACKTKCLMIKCKHAFCQCMKPRCLVLPFRAEDLLCEHPPRAPKGALIRHLHHLQSQPLMLMQEWTGCPFHS